MKYLTYPVSNKFIIFAMTMTITMAVSMKLFLGW